MAEKPSSAPLPVPDRLTVIVSRAEQQTNNPRFSDELREELKQMKLTEEELTELASRFEQSKVLDGIKSDARTVILERVKEDRQTLMKTLNPLTWTPENQRTAAITVGSVAVGALVLAWIGRKMAAAREGAQKTVEAVRGGVRTIRNGIMWTLGTAVLLAGGFAGFKLWQNWGKVEQMFASARMLNEKMLKAGGDKLDAMQKQLAETQKQIAVMTGLAEEKVAAMTAVAGKVKERATAKLTPEEEPAAEAGAESAETPESTEAEPKPATAAEKVAETVAQKFIGKGLMLLHANLAVQAGFNADEDYNASLIEGVLNLAPVRTLRITDLIGIAQSGSFEAAQSTITEKLKEAGVTKELSIEESRAVYFLALVAEAQQKNIRTPEGIAPEEMRVETLLDQTGDVARLLARTKEKMQGVNLADPADIATRLADMYSGSDTLAEDLTSSAAAQKLMESIGLSKEDMAGFAVFCGKTGATLLTSVENLSVQEGERKYVDALMKLRATIMENGALRTDAQHYLELYTHGQDEFLTPLRERMSQLNISDAVQLYLSLDKTRDSEGKLPDNLNDSNPLTALTMQMKVLSMIASKDKYQGDKLKAFLTLQAGQTGTAWLLGESEIELPESLKKTLPVIGSIVSSVAQNKVEDITRQATAAGSEVDKKYPWIKWVAGGLGVDYVARRFARWRGTTISRGLETSVYGAGYATVNRPTLFQWVRQRLPVIGTVELNLANSDMLSRAETFNNLEAGAPPNLGSAPVPAPEPARAAPLPDTDIPDIPDDATIPFQRTPPVADDVARAGNTAEEITRTASGTTETITPRMPSTQDTLPLRTPAQDLPAADLGGPAPRLNPSPAASAAPGPSLNIVREDGSVVDAQGRPVDATPGTTEVTRSAEVAEQLADEARWAKIISKYPGKVSLGDVDAFLRLAQEERLIVLDTDTLALIGESNGAKKIIAGAIESTDIAEITRAMQAAKMARNLRIGLNGLGAAGDVFGLYMAYADFQANGERIESARQTNNQALAELYANANYVYAAEGAQSTAGLVIGGVAIVRAYSGGQTVITSLGASGGLILLPVAVAAVGGGLMYRQAESVSADWTRNAKDWQKTLTPGEMLEKLKATGPGTRSYWQGWGKGTITEMGLRKTFTSREAFEAWEARGEGTIEDANAQMRYELTKGYLASSTMLAPRPQETEEQYRQRFDQFVIDRLEYTTLVTEGMYGYMPSGYQMSNAYAELMAKSRELQKTGGSEKLTWTDSEGIEQSIDIKDFADLPWSAKPGEMGRQFVLGKYFYQNKVNTIMQFNIMEKLPTGLNAEQKKRAIEQQIIQETTDDLMKLDGRIASADFAGLEITGGDQQSKALARYTASRMYLEELDTQAGVLLAQAKTEQGITAESYDKALERIRGVIGSNDPLDYQRIGYERKYIEDGYVLDVAGTQALLMPGTMFKALDKDAKDVKVRKMIKEEAAKTSPESLRKMRKELGELMLIKTEGMVQNGNVFSVQYGNIFNKYLYARYNGDQWQVAIGGGGAGPWSRPEELKASAGGTFGFSADTAGRYNSIIRKLAEANAEFQK